MESALRALTCHSSTALLVSLLSNGNLICTDKPTVCSMDWSLGPCLHLSRLFTGRVTRPSPPIIRRVGGPLIATGYRLVRHCINPHDSFCHLPTTWHLCELCAITRHCTIGPIKICTDLSIGQRHDAFGVSAYVGRTTSESTPWDDRDN